MDFVTIAPAPFLKIRSMLPASSSIKPEARINGLLIFRDAKLISSFTRLTPHPYSNKYI
jgi:hypothetical protein